MNKRSLGNDIDYAPREENTVETDPVGADTEDFHGEKKVSSAWFSDYFRATPRTIQRDLLLLK